MSFRFMITLLASVFTLVACKGAEASGWQIEVVDSSVGYVQPMIELNNLGLPCISYYSRSSTGLRYAYWDGSTWIRQVLDSGAVIGVTSLALDTNERPHIAYWDRTQGSLKYVFWDGTQWHFEIVDTGGTGAFPGLALDRQNFPHITYSDTNRQALKYAYWNGTSWIKGVIVDSFSVGYISALVIDLLNLPHVAYRYYPLRCLKYARWDGTRWQSEIVDTSGGNAGMYPILRLDSQGEPIISHIAGNIAMGVMLSRRSGSVWNTEMVAWYSRAITSNWLYVFPNDSLKIAHTVDEFGVFIAVQTGTGWTRDTVVSPGIYVGVSLAADPTNVFHVAYSGGWLYHARKGPSGVEDEDRSASSPSCSFDAFPNPFYDEVKIILPERRETERISVRVYDLTGRLVKEEVVKRGLGGGGVAAWDGADRYGRKVSSGVYFIVLEQGSSRRTKRVTLLR